MAELVIKPIPSEPGFFAREDGTIWSQWIEDRLKIFQMYERGVTTYAEIGEVFGISTSHVKNVVFQMRTRA